MSSVNGSRIGDIGWPRDDHDAVPLSFLRAWGSLPRPVQAATAPEQHQQPGVTRVNQIDGLPVHQLVGQDILVTRPGVAGVYRVLAGGQLKQLGGNGLISVADGRTNIGTLWVVSQQHARYVGIDTYRYGPVTVTGGQSRILRLPEERVISLTVKLMGVDRRGIPLIAQLDVEVYAGRGDPYVINTRRRWVSATRWQRITLNYRLSTSLYAYPLPEAPLAIAIMTPPDDQMTWSVNVKLTASAVLRF